MKLEEFISKFNMSPYPPSEIAQLAAQVSDDAALAIVAKKYMEYESMFFAELERVGFEIG